LFTWGRGTYGVIGDGASINRSSPVQIGSSSWTAVATGSDFTAAIRSDGGLFTWGATGQGQLGDGSSSAFRSSPVQIGSTSWIAVAAGPGGVHAGAIRSDNILFTWGSNGYGRLGYGTTTFRSSPVQIGGVEGNFFATSPVQLGSSSWTAVDAGGSHTAAIRSDGALFTWGLNFHGQLGDGTIISRSSPVQIGSSSWTAVDIGRSHTAAIRLGGSLFAWGVNPGGQLGDGTTINRSSPVQIGSNSWAAISLGGSHTAGISSNLLYTWGLGTSDGRLGIGLIQNASSPTLIGNNLVGAFSRSSPVQIGTSTWTAVSVGFSHVGAISSTARLYMWGGSGSGQLGQNNNSTSLTPVQVGTRSFTLLSASGYHNIVR